MAATDRSLQAPACAGPPSLGAPPPAPLPAHRFDPATALDAVRAVADVEDAPDSGLGLELRDLALEAIDARLGAAIVALVHEHKLVVLRGLEPSDPAYVELAGAFGTPQVYFQPNYHHPRHEEIFVSSNVPMDGRKVGVAGTGAYWHSDYQFFPQPLPLTMVRPVAIPPGSRGTCYVDMERALERLAPEDRRLVESERAVHEAKWRYKVQPGDVDKSITQLLDEFGADTPAVSHPSVITHPVNARRCLYLSRGFSVGFEGLAHEQARATLQRLFDVIEDEGAVHRHPWTPGDILLWDNRQLIHMARGGTDGEPSVSYRIGVYDGHPFNADEPAGRVLA